MKVYKSKYRNHWISPYTVIDKVVFWKEIDYHDPVIKKWANRLEPISKFILKLLDFIHPQINFIHIDKYDVWSMDHTLADIILPMLKMLKERKHGAPFVDDEDVPEELKSTSAPPKENEWDTDANHFKRWDWVVAEMIQAFESHVEGSLIDKYSTGEHDYQHVKEEHEEFGIVYRMAHGPNHTRETDWVALAAHEERNRNGFRLFGKYYQNLWT